jgi:hypothetical protein
VRVEREHMTLVAPPTTDAPPPDAEVLFKEAKRRRRRLRVGWAVTSVLIIIAVVVGASLLLRQSKTPLRTSIVSATDVVSSRAPRAIVGWTSDFRLVVISTETGRVERTLASDVAILAPGLPNVSVSPNGTVFFESSEPTTSNDDVNGGDQIFAVPVTGGSVRQVTAGSDPQISPNGHLLAFISPDPAGQSGEAPYLVPPVGVDIATLSAQGTIASVRTLAPGPLQLNQGLSDLSWSGNSQYLSFDLLNPTTNVTTSWTVAGDAGSLGTAEQIHLRGAGVTWNGFWGQYGAVGLGIRTSASGSQQVVTINPSTGRVTARLFSVPAAICTTASAAGSKVCSSDFSNLVIGDNAGTSVLVAGAIPFVDGAPTTSGKTYLYRWSVGDRSPVKLTQQVLVAAWGPSASR